MPDLRRRISPRNSLSSVVSAIQMDARRARGIGGAGVRVARTTRGTVIVARRRGSSDDTAASREARWA